MFEGNLVLLWILVILFQLTLLLLAVTLFMFMIWEFRNQRKQQNEKENVKRPAKGKKVTDIAEGGKAEQTTAMLESKESRGGSVPEGNERKKAEKYSSAFLEVNKESAPLTNISAKEQELSVINSLNRMLRSNGYNKYLDEHGFKIGTGGGRNKIGDEISLKEGNGNIKIVVINNELYYGVPDKVTWRGIDFLQGAFRECYISPVGVDNGSNYIISKIKKIAVLIKENEHFKVQQKGEVEVKVK